jgi:FeS assembly protein IscX
MLCNWVIALPDFVDDPQLVNDDLLQAICQEWYEETYPL